MINRRMPTKLWKYVGDGFVGAASFLLAVTMVFGAAALGSVTVFNVNALPPSPQCLVAAWWQARVLAAFIPCLGDLYQSATFS